MEISTMSGRYVFGLSLLLVFVASFAVSVRAQTSIITTHAGSAVPERSAQAVTHPLDQPSAITSDGAGGFYVASAIQNRVYRVTVDGALTLIAGTSSGGFSGDGGLATSARLDHPSGLALDKAGNLYIADAWNGCVRKVTPEGVINTIRDTSGKGFGGAGGSGVAVDATGNLYIADNSARIVKVSGDGVFSVVAGNRTEGFSGDGGPAVSAQIGIPSAVAVDAAGNLYIAEPYNHRVRKVTTDGVIRTVAGNGKFAFEGGPAGINGPYGLALDAAGNLYIADKWDSQIRKVTADGVISIIGYPNTGYGGDGGPVALARFNGPTGVAVDGAGNLYIADTNNSRVRKVTADGIIRTVAGIGTGSVGDGGPATSARLLFPSDVAVDATGNLYIADTINSRVRKVTADGMISTVAGNGTTGFEGNGGQATSAQVFQPVAIAVDEAGNLYIAESDQNVRKVTPGGVISIVAGTTRFGFTGDGGPATSAQLAQPRGIAVDAAGNLYIADSYNHRIRKVTVDGLIRTVAGNGISGFSGDGGPATSAQLSSPSGVAVDTAGNLYIADLVNFRVRKVTSGGFITTIARGTGATDDDMYEHGTGPRDIAVDATGNVYAPGLFWDKDSVSKVTPDGVISTVAGNGISGFSGDGGPGTSAQINHPDGVAVDSAGNVYIADTLNHRVRMVANATDLPLVIGLQFNPPLVSVGSSWTATFTGTNLTDQTYFDVRFQPPGGNTDQVALNWQRGTAAPHSVPNGTDAGTWTITGVRPHQTETDHTGNFFPVSATMIVSP